MSSPGDDAGGEQVGDRDADDRPVEDELGTRRNHERQGPGDADRAEDQIFIVSPFPKLGDRDTAYGRGAGRAGAEDGGKDRAHQDVDLQKLPRQPRRQRREAGISPLGEAAAQDDLAHEHEGRHGREAVHVERLPHLAAHELNASPPDHHDDEGREAQGHADPHPHHEQAEKRHNHDNPNYSFRSSHSLFPFPV